jgi:hypothetical protein
VRLLHYGLLCLLSLAVVGALTATGVILTIAMLIAPGAIAFLLTAASSDAHAGGCDSRHCIAARRISQLFPGQRLPPPSSCF